jgi:peptidoglycan/xylan/chitin deacetylase (PgdA/CDA1 family)
MRRWLWSIPLLLLCYATAAADEQQKPNANFVRDDFGAIIRGDVTQKRLALLFTGDQFGESAKPILDALRARGVKGAFFITGRFLNTNAFVPIVKRIIADGHYVGPHSDGHLLYCDWKDRGKSLVMRDEFTADLRKNVSRLKEVGALPEKLPALFVPPYEWYNREQVAWSAELGLTLINFTPGSGSNRDYAPEGDPHFVAARRIYDYILAYEQRDPHGLNGFLLLLHLGSGRKDPFHPLLGPLCDELKRRGYQFQRVDDLLEPAPG